MTALILSPAASSAIARRAELVAGDLPGLRIAPGQQPSAPLRVAMAPAPQPGDATVEQDGARVFCAPQTEERLDGGRLDARRDDRGRLEFVVNRPAGAQQGPA